MKRRYPDPTQLYDHEGNPEGGSVRYVEVEAGPSHISPSHADWIARKRREALKGKKLTRVALPAQERLPV